jgi:glycosyltransferase involved in cell wall biosynthesis
MTGNDPISANVVMVLKGYPRLSETFIAQEILGLQQAGLLLQLVSLRRPTDAAIHPVHSEIRIPVHYLPEYLYQDPRAVFNAWQSVRRLPGYRKALAAWFSDLSRDPSPNRARRFGQALVLARALPTATALIYAHFLHTPASVARYAAMMRSLPWAVSAHAKDIWLTPEWEKKEKLGSCAWLTTCTVAGQQHLQQLAPPGLSVQLNYHGLDLSRFPEPAGPTTQYDGATAENPVRLLSVGRAVAKKGFDVVLTALADLPDSKHWRFTHVGGGMLLDRLKTQAKALGISDRTTWLGPLDQEKLLQEYRKAHIFVLASRIGPDGDRDGLPNVLMEAASQRLAIAATSLPGIAELITHQRHGLLVPPDDPGRLTEALLQLIGDSELRVRIGTAASDLVRANFNHRSSFLPLLQLFRD